MPAGEGGRAAGLASAVEVVAENGSCRRKRIRTGTAMRKIGSVGAERPGLQAQWIVVCFGSVLVLFSSWRVCFVIFD